MAEFVRSGAIVDLVLALLALELVGLLLLRTLTGLGPAPASLLVTSLSGAFLLLALRAALSDAGWLPIAAALTGSLFAHLADLRLRWQGPARLSPVARPTPRPGMDSPHA